MAETPYNSFLTRLLAARPAGEFAGRDAELACLAAMAEESAAGAEQAIALEGPRGSGKSELLRQLTLALSARSAACLPVYLDLPAFAASGSHSPATDGRAREAIFRALLRQALLGSGSLDPADLQWVESDPARLPGFCYGAGLGALAPLLSESARHLSFVESMRALLAAWRGCGLPPLVLILDGADHDDAAVTGLLSAFLEGARREGCPVFFEAPGETAGSLAPAVAVERFTLEPLPLAEALSLARGIGAARGWTLPDHCLEPILARLGPWPGWVRAWALRVQSQSTTENSAFRIPHSAFPPSPIRLAEEAYVDFLSAGAWCEGLRAGFERLIPLTQRDAALRLLRYALERGPAILPGEAPAMLGLGEHETERVLAGLTRLGLLTRRGSRWGAPATGALADWAELLVASEARAASPAATRMTLLARLLTLPRAAADAAPAAPSVAQLPQLLERFAGQLIPPVLFHFADYYEALGRLAPDQRRDTVRQSSAQIRVPEVIGVAPWNAERAARNAENGPPEIFYARAYREGKYQRSHEEIWIAIDLSAVRMLTTPEVREALQAIEALESTLRPNHFVRWLILGEGASAEALELIRARGMYCSGREQLALIRDLLCGTGVPPVTSSKSETKTESPSPGACVKKIASEPPAPQPRPPRHTVIDLKSSNSEPRAEVTGLRLPARDGSELIAALTAEKIALRSDFDLAGAGQIKTAVLEGVLNAIEHSPNIEKSIDIQFILNPEALEIIIENEGPAFDPLSVPAPDPQAKLTAAHKRGWGLSLMKRFMDEVGYEPCARGTRLRIVKRRRRPTAEAAEMK